MSENSQIVRVLDGAIERLHQTDYSPSVELATSLAGAARHALAQATHPEEIKGVRDKLSTIEHWFKKQRATLIESNLLVAERLRAERKVGAWLRENVRHGGDRQSEKASLHRASLLSDVGISQSDSHRWQRTAAIDEADFETWVQECLNDRELSTAGALRLWRLLFWEAQRAESFSAEEWATTGDSPLRVKRGQVWQLGEHRLMCGDAHNADDMAALIDHAEVDALITDPPYGIDYQPKWDDWTGSPLEHRLVTGDNQPFDPTAFLDYPTVCLWGANYYSNRLPPGGWVCWDKRLGEDADRMFGSPFELGWFRSRHTERRAIMIRVLHAGVINADSEFGNNQKRVHPTQKPIQLMADLLNSVTQKGELVLDPFAGSGSVLLACNHTGRRFYGMEIEPEYVGVILARWLEATGEEPVIQEDDNGGD